MSGGAAAGGEGRGEIGEDGVGEEKRKGELEEGS